MINKLSILSNVRNSLGLRRRQLLVNVNVREILYTGIGVVKLDLVVVVTAPETILAEDIGDVVTW